MALNTAIVEARIREVQHLADLDPTVLPALELRPIFTQSTGSTRTADHYSHHAFHLRCSGDLDGAVDHYSRAVQLQPNNFKAMFNRGYVYLQKGSFDLAASDFASAAKMQPKNPLSYYNLGITYLHSQKPKKAVDALETAVKLSPDDMTLQSALARALRQAGRFREAIQLYSSLRSDITAPSNVTSPSSHQPFSPKTKAISRRHQAVDRRSTFQLSHRPAQSAPGGPNTAQSIRINVLDTPRSSARSGHHRPAPSASSPRSARQLPWDMAKSIAAKRTRAAIPSNIRARRPSKARTARPASRGPQSLIRTRDRAARSTSPRPEFRAPAPPSWRDPTVGAERASERITHATGTVVPWTVKWMNPVSHSTEPPVGGQPERRKSAPGEGGAKAAGVPPLRLDKLRDVRTGEEVEESEGSEQTVQLTVHRPQDATTRGKPRSPGSPSRTLSPAARTPRPSRSPNRPHQSPIAGPPDDSMLSWQTPLAWMDSSSPRFYYGCGQIFNAEFMLPREDWDAVQRTKARCKRILYFRLGKALEGAGGGTSSTQDLPNPLLGDIDDDSFRVSQRHIRFDAPPPPPAPIDQESLEFLMQTTRTVRFFRDLPTGLLALVCDRLQYVEKEKGDVVYKQNSVGTTMWILLEGSVGVYINRLAITAPHASTTAAVMKLKRRWLRRGSRSAVSPPPANASTPAASGRPPASREPDRAAIATSTQAYLPTGHVETNMDELGARMGTLYVGESFGETAMDHNPSRWRRKTSAVCAQESAFLMLRRSAFHEALAQYRKDNFDEFRRFLGQVPLFQECTPAERAKLVRRVLVRRALCNTVLLTEEEETEHIIVVRSGQIRLEKTFHMQPQATLNSTEMAATPLPSYRDILSPTPRPSPRQGFVAPTPGRYSSSPYTSSFITPRRPGQGAATAGKATEDTMSARAQKHGFFNHDDPPSRGGAATHTRISNSTVDQKHLDSYKEHHTLPKEPIPSAYAGGNPRFVSPALAGSPRLKALANPDRDRGAGAPVSASPVLVRSMWGSDHQEIGGAASPESKSPSPGRGPAGGLVKGADGGTTKTLTIATLQTKQVFGEYVLLASETRAAQRRAVLEGQGDMADMTTAMHPAPVTLVAATNVELFLIRKQDVFECCDYHSRQRMLKFMESQPVNVQAASDPEAQLLWHEYKNTYTKELRESSLADTNRTQPSQFSLRNDSRHDAAFGVAFGRGASVPHHVAQMFVTSRAQPRSGEMARVGEADRALNHYLQVVAGSAPDSPPSESPRRKAASRRMQAGWGNHGMPSRPDRGVPTISDNPRPKSASHTTAVRPRPPQARASAQAHPQRGRRLYAPAP